MSVDIIRGKTVLITGGAGSLGQHITKKILPFAKKIIIFSRGEEKQVMMERKFANSKLRFFLGDIRDKNRLNRSLKGVDIVLHAAAQKHIDRCSYNFSECINTNINGTLNVMDACIDNNIERALFVSTDKALAVSIYGSSKFTGEQIFINGNNYSTRNSTKFVVSRYGNVYGSSGSFANTIKEQKKQGLVKITHPNMSRFFMSMREAVDLNLYALNNTLTGGEIFIPKLKATKIINFANVFAPNIPIKYIGVRGYEKIHEGLISETEMRYTVDCGDYYKIIPPHVGDPNSGWCGDYEHEDFVDPFKYTSDVVEQFTDEELLAFDKEQ